LNYYLPVEILDEVFWVFVHLNWMIIIIPHLVHLQMDSRF
jgi:hypothetical protein